MAGLTAKAIEQAKPKAARYEKPDDGCAGLYLVVQPSGAKSWALRFRSPLERDASGARKAKKLTLGPLATLQSTAKPEIGHPLSLGQARVLATAALEQVRHGIDPTLTRRAEKAKAKEAALADNTIDAAVLEFLKRYKGKKRQGLRESTRRLTATYFGLRPDPEIAGAWKKTGQGVLGKWSGKPLTSITKRDAITLLDGIVDKGHGVTANRTLTVLKTFFQWCVKVDLLTASPVVVLDAVAEEKERERILSANELAAVWRAAIAEGYPFGHLTRMAILTGARRDEMRNAPASEFQIDGTSLSLANGDKWNGPLWTLPADRAKNGNPHLMPLSSLTVDLLRDMPNISGKALLFTLTGTTPVSGLSKAKERLDKAAIAELQKLDPNAEMQPWTLHDLRRTFYSGLQALGFPIEVADACVNHSGNIRGAAKHYAWHQYLAEKTAAFDAWAKHIQALVDGAAK